MGIINIEIKAQCADTREVEKILSEEKADFIGTDHQVDTYFDVSKGRLKLREGNIENALIHYHRENISGPKKSNVLLYKTTPNSGLKKLLSESLGVKVVVDKQRKIYFIENIKFHIDKVKSLGSFIEIEAIDETGQGDQAKLFEQCQRYLDKFRIDQSELVDVSYSDLLMQKNT